MTKVSVAPRIGTITKPPPDASQTGVLMVELGGFGPLTFLIANEELTPSTRGSQRVLTR